MLAGENGVIADDGVPHHMSTIAGEPPAFELGPDDPGPGAGLPPGVRLVRVTAAERFAAAVRLVGDQTDDPRAAAARFLESAEHLGIDLSLMWATVGAPPESAFGFRQVALIVPGSGRTAMVFVSGPSRRRMTRAGSAELGGGSGPTRERAAAIQAACRGISDLRGGFALAQALLEPRETEAIVAFRAAGFTQVGDLAYLRRIAPAPTTSPPAVRVPEGFQVRSIAALQAAGTPQTEIDRLLIAALDRSYIDTSDCPELCGMRSTADVLASHRAVGRYDPALWWLFTLADRPEGCLLLSVSPEQDSVELVYLGLSPVLRGRGLGAWVLHHGLRVVHGRATAGEDPGFVDPSQPVPTRNLVGGGGVTCAVDTRNEPAIRLYRRLGFQRFAVRVPLVRRLGPSDTSGGMAPAPPQDVG